MKITSFQEQLFEAGRTHGYTDMEIYYSASRSLAVMIRAGEVDSSG